MADYGLTLGDLMGIIQEFFKKLGITKLRFKPAYNPYTEPSMEIFSYHEGKEIYVYCSCLSSTGCTFPYHKQFLSDS